MTDYGEDDAGEDERAEETPEEVMAAHDKNKDGKLSFEELSGKSILKGAGQHICNDSRRVPEYSRTI